MGLKPILLNSNTPNTHFFRAPRFWICLSSLRKFFSETDSADPKRSLNGLRRKDKGIVFAWRVRARGIHGHVDRHDHAPRAPRLAIGTNGTSGTFGTDVRITF